ncbi:MAG TPA: VCBS repeat-containing protein [Cyclobacteriaceae bacterium]|nr:VCBS repeat-containing protein [Cyclobacteriaceae bacterium]HPW61282.1 VCBS repeat-containing protein [Cyclobacteriaceae bacterium]
MHRFFLIIFFCYLFFSCSRRENIQQEESRFTLIPVEYSHVTFSNNLSYSEELNPYTYRNFYNGAGVAVGDINNDNLPDLYFAGNQVNNKLYLNEGNFKFRDITQVSGTACKGVWSTGVAMVDINADGWLDIYVCKSGGPGSGIRHNELFINNKDLTFTERSKEYGLDVVGLSTHAVFFDYDRDGDLDCYVLSNSMKSIGAFDLSKDKRTIPDETNQGAKLLNNFNGYFKDATISSGIYSSKIGFGLGVAIGDINLDGWLDIYVSNDFFERDYLYINLKNGTFREELEEHLQSISLGSMGADLADLNNDGYPDIFVTEMLPDRIDRYKTKAVFENWDKHRMSEASGYYHQYPRNVYQQNTGHGYFQEIGRLAGIEATDWSWGALAADFDGDQLKDIFVANGIGKDLTDQDYVNFMADPSAVKDILKRKGAVIKELIDVIPSEPLSNYMFKNIDGFSFKSVAQDWGLGHTSFSNGASYGDLDNDGDLDLVVSNINQEPFLYRNESSYHSITLKLVGSSMNSMAIGSKIEAYSDGILNWSEFIPSRGFMSSIDYRTIIPVGNASKVDSLIIHWPQGGTSRFSDLLIDSIYTFYESTAKKGEESIKPGHESFILKQTNIVVHVDVENDFNDFDRDRLLYHMISNEGPRMCQGDVNGDKLSDFYIGGSQGESGSLYVQERSGGFRKISAAIFEVDKVSEDCGCAFFDMDNDGDDDLYVTSGSNELPNSSSALLDRLYVNAGGGRFTKSNQLLPTSNFESTSVVKPSDFDGDGDMDLFVGVRVQPFVYGVPVNGYLLENNGRGNFTEVSSSRAPELRSLGMITDAVWSDVEGDGDDDLLVVGEWMQIRLLINSGGVFKDVSDTYGLLHTSGWWNRIVSRDLDGDGDDDYVVGNHGLNSRFKASVEKPISMWVNDFDQNGTVEQIICRWWGDRQYPLALRHDLVSQLPGLKKKYLKYESFKDQGMEEIFSAEELKGSLKWEAEELRSMVIYNEGDHFRLEALPIEAQLSPVYGIAVSDYDGDGNEDIVLGGNQYRSKPEVGRYDASYGVYLKGDGNGGFKNLPAEQSGIWIRGEVRDMLTIKSRKENLLLISVNSDSLKIYKY